MGTRATVKFYNREPKEEVKPILSLYFQFDGYYEGVGEELAEFLTSKTIVNGYQSGQTMETGFANGMGCLAAQYLKSIKTDIGGVYCTTENSAMRYDYRVWQDEKDNLVMEIDEFKGHPSLFSDWIKEENEEE